MKYTNNTIRINYLFILSVVILFVVFAVKLSYVALNTEVEGVDLAELASNRSKGERILYAERGRIYDNAGEVLAQNVNSYKMIAYLNESRTTNEKYPKHVVDKNYTASELAKVLNESGIEVTEQYLLDLLNQKGLYQTEFGTVGKGLTEKFKKKNRSFRFTGD